LTLIKRETENKSYDSNLTKIKNLLENDSVALINKEVALEEEQVVFFMTVSKLNEELKEKDNK